jgi:uncharacterized protein YegP (UPF0339 family)
MIIGHLNLEAILVSKQETLTEFYLSKKSGIKGVKSTKKKSTNAFFV